MSSEETPILNADDNQEEKITLTAKKGCCSANTLLVISIIIPLIMTIFVFAITGQIILFFPGIILVLAILACCIDTGSEVTVNKKNGILKFQRIKPCLCGRKNPRLFDLNQIQKINLYSLGEILGSGGQSKGQSYKCFITYKSGVLEDVSNYFTGYNGYSVESTADFENMIRKYVPLENTMPLNFQQGGDNSSILPVYSNNITPDHNPNTPPVYNYNMVNDNNSGMAQGIPQNNNQQGYNTNDNINVNTNQNNNAQQTLSTENEVNKPGKENENYGAPGLQQ